MIKRLIVGGVAVLAVGGSIWGVSGQDHTKRNTAGTVVTAGQLGVFVMHLGDCFSSIPNGTTRVSTLESVPCTSPHHWQDVYKGTLSDLTFDDKILRSESRALCISQITSLAKKWNQTIAHEYATAQGNDLTPTVESWAKGDRTVDCVLGNETISYTDSVMP